MSKHITQDQAFDALCNPDVPPGEAVKLFKRAYRRSNVATKAFVLWMAGRLRAEKGRRGRDE